MREEWYSIQGDVTKDTQDLYVEEKADAVQQLATRIHAVAGRAKAAKDGETVQQLEELLECVGEYLFLEMEQKVTSVSSLPS